MRLICENFQIVKSSKVAFRVESYSRGCQTANQLKILFDYKSPLNPFKCLEERRNAAASQQAARQLA